MSEDITGMEIRKLRPDDLWSPGETHDEDPDDIAAHMIDYQEPNGLPHFGAIVVHGNVALRDRIVEYLNKLGVRHEPELRP